MKTEHEIEQMKIEIQEKISITESEIYQTWANGSSSLLVLEKRLSVLKGQYNILCEVLR